VKKAVVTAVVVVVVAVAVAVAEQLFCRVADSHACSAFRNSMSAEGLLERADLLLGQARLRTTYAS
jgi:hypothetical protein